MIVSVEKSEYKFKIVGIWLYANYVTKCITMSVVPCTQLSTVKNNMKPGSHKNCTNPCVCVCVLCTCGLGHYHRCECSNVPAGAFELRKDCLPASEEGNIPNCKTQKIATTYITFLPMVLVSLSRKTEWLNLVF